MSGPAGRAAIVSRKARSCPNHNKRQLWLPPGIAHGFVVLSATAEFLDKATDYWAPEFERCIVWNDPTLAMARPALDGPPGPSEKEARGQEFSHAEFFDQGLEYPYCMRLVGACQY